MREVNEATGEVTSLLHLAPGTSADEAVFTALGFASACWDNLKGAGEFRSTEAEKAGRELLAHLHTLGLPE